MEITLSIRKKEKLTLKAISEDLRISKTTISLVLKGDGDRYRISKATQKRILEHIELTGFQPNFLAKALSTKRTATIGLIFPDVHEAFMSEMVQGIESVLYPAGYSMMLSTSGFNSDFERRNLKQLFDRGIDGLIIVPYIPIAQPNFDHGYMSAIEGSNCPVVFVDRLPPENQNLNWIIQDDYESAKKAVKLLFEKGCRKIGCLSFNLPASSVQNRIQGYKDALKELDLVPDDRYLILLNEQDKDSEDLYMILKNLALNQDLFDGLFVTTGGIAHKAGYLFKKHDINIPDIPIVKVGKDPEMFSSGMTRIIQPNVEMGRQAAETILLKTNGRESGLVQIEIPTKFIESGDAGK